MKLGAKNANNGWKVVSLAMVCALMLGPLTACDTNVNETLVSGLNDVANGLATTLIDAAFQMVTPDETTNDPGTVSGGGDTVPQI